MDRMEGRRGGWERKKERGEGEKEGGVDVEDG